MNAKLSPEPHIATQLTAFVDSSVIAAYLTGGEAASRLFNNGLRDPVRFVVDPVVLQNVLSLPQIQKSPDLLEALARRLNFEVLPLDMEQGQRMLRRAKELRSRVTHSSDILIAASASGCDYLIMYDGGLQELVEGDRPRVVTPEQFTSLMPIA